MKILKKIKQKKYLKRLSTITYKLGPLIMKLMKLIEIMAIILFLILKMTMEKLLIIHKLQVDFAILHFALRVMLTKKY